MIKPEPSFYAALQRFLSLTQQERDDERIPIDSMYGILELRYKSRQAFEEIITTRSPLEVGEKESSFQKDGFSGMPCSWGAVDCPHCGDAALFAFVNLRDEKESENEYYHALCTSVGRCRKCGQLFYAADALHEPQKLAEKARSSKEVNEKPALIDKRVSREDFSDGSYSERTECKYDDGSMSTYTRHVYASGQVSAKMYTQSSDGQVSSFRLREPIDKIQREKYYRRQQELQNPQQSFWRKLLDEYGFALAWYSGMAVIILIIVMLD